MAKPDPFAGLTLTQERPLGTGSIEQRLFQPTQSKQQESPSSHLDRKTSRQEDTPPAKQQKPKVGFRLSLQGIAALDDMKLRLLRTHGIRALKEDIIEEAIMTLYRDFEAQEGESIIVRHLSSHQDGKTSR